jgi:hypothetical protein
MSITFQESKAELSNILRKISERLPFPITMIQSVRENGGGFRGASGYFEKYNQTIVKARELLIMLQPLTEWGTFLNSYYLWKVSVAKVVSYYDSYRNAILRMCNVSNPFEQIFYKQCNIDSTKLIAFMAIQVNSLGKLIIETPDSITQVDMNKIPHLLPKFATNPREYFNLEIYYLDSDEIARIQTIREQAEQAEQVGQVEQKIEQEIEQVNNEI